MKPFAGEFYLDLSGEAWKARAWGYAQLRLRDVVAFEHCTNVFPSLSFGETGAASGVAGVCLAVRALARGYARSNHAVICSINDFGHTSAIMISGVHH
jgi:3-oxoacyl-[acyl-carrier-protein] synthase-1